MRIELSRSVVRSLTPADAPTLARHANNRNVWRNLRDLFPYPYTEADAVAFIDKARAQSPERLYAIE
ncbi:MAG: GNAT family N-acetyltransferase, partial [Candidatus Eisenbacteria bacterium]|nr:GNAT family N-acetyltransferase [Candidatus Eisenbacteria bacterium]